MCFFYCLPDWIEPRNKQLTDFNSTIFPDNVKDRSGTGFGRRSRFPVRRKNTDDAATARHGKDSDCPRKFSARSGSKIQTESDCTARPVRINLLPDGGCSKPPNAGKSRRGGGDPGSKHFQGVITMKNEKKKRNWNRWIGPDVFSFIRKKKSL